MNNYLNNYTLTYRQDIDILRGLAVLSVVLYHFAPGRIPGGFLGVDIFFVISGYLITNIILKKDVNNFSFLDFYSRRIKRIFPSLIIVLATFLLLAFFFLSEIDFIQFSKHLSASSIFILNFILINEAGYFDSSSIFKPLLHLWSLSIEEQFYIFWPLLIFLLHKTKSNIFFFSFIVAISSFFFNIFFLKNEIFTFYFPIARFWELLSGSILSVILFSYKKKIIFFSNFTIRLIKFFGYILIIVSFFFIKELKNFYLFFYFATVFGTFLVIFCGSLINIEERSSVFHKILSWFGLISFPLYLWHWPILSFLRIAEGGEIDRSTRVIALFISIFLSWLTYCFVEKKIRFSKNKIMPIILIIFLTLLGVFGYVSFKYRIFNEYLFTKIKFQGDTGHHEFFKYLKSNYYNCNNKILNEFAGSFEGTKRCYESKLNKNIEYILIGDSTAEHFYPGIANELTEKNLAGYFTSGLPTSSNQEYKIILEQIKKIKNIKAIFISANWNNYSDPQTQELYYNNDLSEYIQSLKKYSEKIYIISGAPSFSFHPNKCKYYNKFFKNECEDLKSSRADVNLNNLENIKNRIYVLNTTDLLCKKNRCSMIFDNKILFRDDLHLNLYGSEFYGKKIFELMHSK